MRVYIDCPCGERLTVFSSGEDEPRGWATVANSNYLRLLKLERRIEDIAPGHLEPDEPHLRLEYDALMQEAASLCGALYECPACGRVLWRLPDEETWRVYERRASERDLRTVVDEAGDATGAPGT